MSFHFPLHFTICRATNDTSTNTPNKIFILISQANGGTLKIRGRGCCPLLLLFLGFMFQDLFVPETSFSD